METPPVLSYDRAAPGGVLIHVRPSEEQLELEVLVALGHELPRTLLASVCLASGGGLRAHGLGVGVCIVLAAALPCELAPKILDKERGCRAPVGGMVLANPRSERGDALRTRVHEPPRKLRVFALHSLSRFAHPSLLALALAAQTITLALALEFFGLLTLALRLAESLLDLRRGLWVEPAALPPLGIVVQSERVRRKELLGLVAGEPGQPAGRKCLEVHRERLELTGPGVSVVTRDAGLIGLFTLSDTGTLLYAAVTSTGSRLVWVDRETGEAQPLASPRRTYFHAHLSPDEDRVLVDGSGALGIFEISSEVFEPLGVAGWGIWTPDGRSVTYARRQVGTGYDIFEKPADGSGTETALLVRDLMQVPGAWSPDGQTLAFGGTGGIWLLSRDTEGPPLPWMETDATEREPQFSPNGEWVAYSSNESGRFEVHVRSLTGDVRRVITTEGGGGPRWSRDGRELFYRSGNGMYAVEVSTEGTFDFGRPTLLFEGSYWGDTNGIASYDVSRDGQRFLMIDPGTSEAPLMQPHVVVNWFEELKQRVPTGR